MPITSYDYRKPNYSGQISGGLESLSGYIRDSEDRAIKAEDRQRRNRLEDAEQQHLNAPLTDFHREGIERVANGENPLLVAEDILVKQHLAQQSKPMYGPMADHYATGETEPVAGGQMSVANPQQSSGMRIPKTATNRDIPQLLQLAQAMSADRNREAMANWRGDKLDIDQARLDAQLARDADMSGYRQELAAMMAAKRAALPTQLAQRDRALDISGGNLGMRGQELSLGQQRQNFAENKEYLKNTNETAWTIPAIDNILMKARTTPGMVPPPEDYTKRRTAEMLSKIPLVGGMASAVMTRSADQDLTQQQRDFRRQVQLAITPFRKLIVGSQITEGEMGIINELAGGQLSIEDTIAGLAALRQMMGARQGRNVQAFPGAASRIGNPSMGQTLPPLSSGQDNDPYGLGALQENPELEYFKQFGYESGVQ